MTTAAAVLVLLIASVASVVYTWMATVAANNATRFVCSGLAFLFANFAVTSFKLLY